MRILYHSRHRVPANIERELAAQWVDRDTLMRESDFLSLHVPLTPETRHSISRREFALMKPTAFVINTARGNIIEEEALVEALQAGKLAGAGLDVFEHEPKVHPALMAMNNVVLLPHIGSATAETRLRMALLASVNLLAALGWATPSQPGQSGGVRLRNTRCIDASAFHARQFWSRSIVERHLTRIRRRVLQESK